MVGVFPSSNIRSRPAPSRVYCRLLRAFPERSHVQPFFRPVPFTDTKVKANSAFLRLESFLRTSSLGARGLSLARDADGSPLSSPYVSRGLKGRRSTERFLGRGTPAAEGGSMELRERGRLIRVVQTARVQCGFASCERFFGCAALFCRTVSLFTGNLPNLFLQSGAAIKPCELRWESLEVPRGLLFEAHIIRSPKDCMQLKASLLKPVQFSRLFS